MSHRSLLSGLFAASLSGALTVNASAAAVGTYLFDTISNPTPALAPFEEFADSSGNGLDLVKQEPFGAVSLDTDRPGVMPAGTFALNSVAGGTGSIITANTDLFSVKKNNGLTIEFWFKPQSNASLAYIMEFGNEGANGWEFYQTTSGDDITLHAGFRQNDGTYFDMNETAFSFANPEWKHVAMTMDTGGAAKLYLDGAEVGSAGYGDLSTFDVQSGFLRLGAGSGATFSNLFLIDELRISDTALLPGLGTGVGELAWNATLVPEPASLALVALGGLAMLGRGRRAAA